MVLRISNPEEQVTSDNICLLTSHSHQLLVLNLLELQVQKVIKKIPGIKITRRSRCIAEVYSCLAETIENYPKRKQCIWSKQLNYPPHNYLSQ
jgi:hypothetical protein